MFSSALSNAFGLPYSGHGPGGKFTVTDGPFIELKELMGGWAVIRAKSLDEAIEWCKRFRNIVGEGESEIVQVFGPEDMGAM